MLDLSLEGGDTLKGYKVNWVRSISGGRGHSERIQGELG